MSTTTSLVAQQYRLQEWAEQVKECKNRPSDMTVEQWCNLKGITRANYYYRLTQVRKALLASIPHEEDIDQKEELSFVEITSVPGQDSSKEDPSYTNETPAAILHIGNNRIELLNSANSVFIKTVLEVLRSC